MEDPVDLEDNLETLLSEMETLNSVRIHVKKKGERRMEMWVQNAMDQEYFVGEIQNEIEEVKRNGFSANNLSLRQKLNSNVMEHLNKVNILIQGANLSSNSIDALMREPFTFEKPNRYKYDELMEYTSNFKNKIGAGAFGDVYLGKFPNGLEIAVKVLNVKKVSMFVAEVRTMGNIYHRHLVKLFGFCLDGKNKALVYEYMKNGSLDMFLYKKDSGVEWSVFYRIAVEVAMGLAYLHDGCTDQIIHHDVRAASVLLDAHFTPRVTNFGMAYLLTRDESHYTNIAGKGTRGYTAPEVWSPFSRITFRCDVYSFGMLLFEVLGRGANLEGNNWFPRRVWNSFSQGKLDDVIVGCGIREKDRRKAKLLTLVAFWCAQHTPETRPTMTTVATVLSIEILVNVPPNPFLPTDPREFQMRPANDSDLDLQRKIEALNVQLSTAVLEHYEKICPPGGENAAILYTISAGGLRKTLSDCEYLSSILESHKVTVRDLWVNPQFTMELKDVLKRIEIPALFVRGRFIGGADQVKTMENEGKLGSLFYGLID